MVWHVKVLTRDVGSLDSFSLKSLKINLSQSECFLPARVTSIMQFIKKQCSQTRTTTEKEMHRRHLLNCFFLAYILETIPNRLYIVRTRLLEAQILIISQNHAIILVRLGCVKEEGTLGRQQF